MNREELVENMCNAGNKACGLPVTKWRGEHSPENIKFCAAALDAAVEELLKPITDGEWQDSVLTVVDCGKRLEVVHRDVADREILAARRAKYARHKTIEERVTIEQQGVTFAICLDGNVEFSFGRRERAEIYRKGLIAELKEKEAGVGA